MRNYHLSLIFLIVLSILNLIFANVIATSEPAEECICTESHLCKRAHVLYSPLPKGKKCKPYLLCCSAHPLSSEYSGSLSLPSASTIQSCECVPRHVCEDKRNGKNIIAEKLGCLGQDLVVCCFITTPSLQGSNCTCVPSNQCKDSYGSGTLESRNSCPIQGQVCCSNPLTTTEQPIVYTVINTQAPQCECVPSEQCKDSYGPGIITSRNSCPIQGQVCCSNPLTITEQPIVSTEINTQTPQCECVPSEQCIEQFGAGIISERSDFCGAGQVCCRKSHMFYKECGMRRIHRIGSPREQGTSESIETNPINRIDSLHGLAKETSTEEFPWMAQILKTEYLPNKAQKERLICGASLLSPYIVLTAAHCIHNIDKNSLKVRVEKRNNNVAGGTLPHQDRSVVIIHEHPGFEKDILFNDLAMMVVDKGFKLAEHVSPICSFMTNTSFAEPNAYNPNRCIIAGWGRRSKVVKTDQATMKMMDLSIVPNDECESELRKSKLGEHFILHSSFMCAWRRGSDTCKGDGGGPLFCESQSTPNQYIQVGVIAWGLSECDGRFPGVFADLNVNREWLTHDFMYLNTFHTPIDNE